MKQKEDNRTVDMEDIVVWPDGMWYYRYEMHEAKHKSDDFRVIYFGTQEYDDFFEMRLGE